MIHKSSEVGVQLLVLLLRWYCWLVLLLVGAMLDGATVGWCYGSVGDVLPRLFYNAYLVFNQIWYLRSRLAFGRSL